MKKFIAPILVFILSTIVAFTPYISYFNSFWANISSPAIVAEKLTTCIGILFALLSAGLLLQFSFFQFDITQVRDSIKHHIENSATIKRLSSEDFYTDFFARSKTARTSIWISYLAPFPPETPNRKDRNKYYKEMLELIKQKGKSNVGIRRLVRWSEANREWIKGMLEELGKTPGFELAILHDINENSPMPLALSVQIIDGMYVWIVAAGDHEQIDDYRDIEIASKEFGLYFKQYYSRLWSMADVAKDSSRGLTEIGAKILDNSYMVN